jgi:hypothetical protein
MWFQFVVINVGDGYVLMLPERKENRSRRGFVFSGDLPLVI